MPHAERALGGFADQGEGGYEQVVHRLAGSELGLELGRLAADLRVAQLGIVVFEGRDGFDLAAVASDEPVVRTSEQFAGDAAETQHGPVLLVTVYDVPVIPAPVQETGRRFVPEAPALRRREPSNFQEGGWTFGTGER